MPKKVSKTIKTRSLWRHRFGLLRFLEAFEHPVFLKILWSAKSWPKICKLDFKASKGDLGSNFWKGRRVRRCPLKLFRAVLEFWMNSSAWSCTLVPRQAGGGGYLRAPPYPPTPQDGACKIYLEFYVLSWDRAEQTEANNQNEVGPAFGLKVGAKIIEKQWKCYQSDGKRKGEQNASTN